MNPERWPTRTEHRREVIDGPAITGQVVLVVEFDGTEHVFDCGRMNLDGQPVTALKGLARDDAQDLLDGCRYELREVTP